MAQAATDGPGPTSAAPGRDRPGRARGLPCFRRGLRGPRIARKLADQGVVLDRKTVAASMRRQGLEGISPRRFTPVTTIQDPAARGFADHAQRRWDQGRLDAIWTSDITYLRTGEGWLYLAAVRDGHSRRVLGWAMDECQDASLVDRALRMAHTLRGTVPEGLVFHADRGVQYTSQMLFETCEELEVLQSMGRTGVCWDNAMAESFWATLKTEFYDRRSWPTRAEARREVARWIEIVYNRRRLHSSLDYTSPVAFENAIDHDQAETEEHTDQAEAA
ncbi:IS3 family transposase [Brachybacterium paraconglomeratum]|uniref:IS3 family transposase n=1 Tax=Brachybacterium paraconglomeratum TaxID=173362 RepID=A0A3R8X6W5_9MICO|nr:IS3 family transposase [Brachybacterium paraconglomeratum]